MIFPSRRSMAFFFNDTATTEIYTLSLHDALPIAGADVWRTQWVAMMLALSGFIIPFSFAYDPALMLIGAGVGHIVLRTIASTLGIVMLGAGLIGYFVVALRPWERAVMLAGSLLLIFPGVVSDVLGVACLIAVF